MNCSLFRRILILITLFTGMASSQSYNFVKEIGNFNKASSFSLSPEGYFFVSDMGSSQVLKLDMDGAVLNSAGGYGWDTRSLSTPLDVCAEMVYVLVADEENNKINKYDKSLNLAGTVYKKESLLADEVFGYPLSVTVSTLGDLYVLDGENRRVVYFNFFGDYKGNFGGFNSGFYTLNRPRKITALKNSLAVLDGRDLVFFDLFGSYTYKLTFDENFLSVKAYDGQVTLTSKTDIYLAADKYDLEFYKLELSEHLYFVDSIAAGDMLYILNANSIRVFKKGN